MIGWPTHRHAHTVPAANVPGREGYTGDHNGIRSNVRRRNSEVRTNDDIRNSVSGTVGDILPPLFAQLVAFVRVRNAQTPSIYCTNESKRGVTTTEKKRRQRDVGILFRRNTYGFPVFLKT